VVNVSLKASAYSQDDEASWDRLVAAAPMGTFLHTRRFLSYHGSRFQDCSVVLRNQRDDIIGILPAAYHPESRDVVTSHPGATFGGLVHDGALQGAALVSAMAAVAGYLRNLGVVRLQYAAVPWIYHQRPSGDDLYALFVMGAKRYRCDLSCAIELTVGARLSSRRRRALKKAHKASVQIETGAALADEFWPVLEQNLGQRHGARPTHSLDEIKMLLDRCPEEIEIVVARIGQVVEGGTVLFLSPTVAHAQYIASTADGNRAGALDAVFDHCIRRAVESGRRIFDLGTSNREGGRVLNASLYDFKAQFGGGGVVHEFYELDLSTATPNPVSP